MKRIFVDPAYPVYENNKLFDKSDLILNRDDTLLPYINLREDFKKINIEILTYDLIKNFKPSEIIGDGYISFGNIRDLQYIKESGLRLLAFYIQEPPLIVEKPYKQLPYLTQYFEKVFTHNTTGDCFSLLGVEQSKLNIGYWPQPYTDIVEKYWSNSNRKKAIILISGNHKPIRFPDKELYSHRIAWAVKLNKYMEVALYGRGWNKLLSLSSWWLPFLINFFNIQKIYQGPCQSKLEVMMQYDFALCFENIVMSGYITEKIFDCFYSGTIPVYRGGNDITDHIPKNCFIDVRNFRDAEELSSYLLKMTDTEKQCFREEARAFVKGPEGKKYYCMKDSLDWFL